VNERDCAAVFGVPVDRLRLEALLERVDAFVADGAPRTISYVNVHVLNEMRGNAELLRFLAKLDLCYCDGNGVKMVAQILGESLPERMTGADWIWDLASRSAGRHKLFWLGGAPGVTERAAEVLRAEHPSLQVDADHGYHSKSGPENDALIARINASGADILLVGMGTPVQEDWVATFRDRLQVPVVWCLGATADFLAGEQARGPDWLVERHEWLARLLSDPRRLWRRYLLGNVTVLTWAMWQRCFGRD